MGTGQMEIENKASDEESVIMKDVLVGRVRIAVPDEVKVSSSGDASPHRQVLAAGTTKSPQSNQAAAMTRPGSVQPNIPLTPAAAPDKSALPASAQSAATAPAKSSNAQPNVKQVYTVVKPRPVATPVNPDANHQPIAAPKQPIPAPKPVDTPKPIATPAKPEATIARPAIIPPRPIAAQIKPVSVAKSCDIRAKKAVEQFEVASRIDVTDGAESRSADTDATASHSAGSEPFLQDEPVAEESVSRFSRSALSKNDVDSVIGDLILTSDEEDEFELILNIGDCTFDAMNMGDCELMKIPEQLEMGSCSSKSKKVLFVEESKDDEKIPSPSDLSPFMPSYLVQNAEILSAPVIIPPSQLAQSFRSLSTSSTSPSSKPPPTFKLATLPELSLETPAAAFMKQLEYSDSETSSDDDDDVVILEETGVGENNNVIFSKAADTSPVKTLPSKSRPSIINADVDMWKDFKIPKGPSKFPVKDSHFKEMIKCGGKMTSIRRFLTEENIIPNLDSVDNWSLSWSR